MKFSGKGKVKPFPWSGLFFFRAWSAKHGMHGNWTIHGMEMGFTWTFPENEIKKQFFHPFFNFCKIMIVKILTIKIFHRSVEKQQNVIVNLFTMKFYCFSTSLWKTFSIGWWKNLFHLCVEKDLLAYKYINSSL